MPLLIVGLIIFSIFLLLFFQDRRRLINYFILGISLLITGMFLIFAISDTLLEISDNSAFVKNIISYAFIIVLFIIAFVIISIPFSLIINGGVLVKKEGFRITNLLSLLIGAGIIGYVIASDLITSQIHNRLLITIYQVFSSIFTYLIFFIFLVLFSVFIYLLFPTRKKVDYIIVLGCGLINGKVTPLLAGRLNKAIQYNNRQYKKHKFYATYVVSGGQGNDESISEAQAMKNYLLEQGIPESNILLEDKSASTEENLKFSKRIIEQQASSYSAIFATSNYHVFRAALLAKRLHFKINGIGSRTVWYFFPNAMIRELVAITLLYKNWHIIYSLIQILFALMNYVLTS